MHVRQWVAVGVVGFVLVAGAAGTRAGDADGDPAAFAKGLERASSLYERGRAKSGLKALQELLEEHVRRPYARARRVEIEDLARRLAFRAQADVPDPKTVVSGKLHKWDAKSGKIKIEYTSNTHGDLEHAKDGTWYLPMPLRGPATIEIEGSSYPRTTEECPNVYLGGGHSTRREVDQSYMIVFGTPPYTEGSEEVWMPVRIVRYDGDKRTVMFSKDISPARPGKSYKLKVKFTTTSIQASINGKSVAKAKKIRDVWGYLGIECKGWETMTLAGEVEPAWIQSKIDEALSKQREAFDKTYDRSKVLPAWLFEEGPAPDTKPEDESPDLPEPLDEACQATYVKVLEAVSNEKLGEALRLIDEMKDDGAPESVCAYLAACAKAWMGKLKEALALSDACVKVAPEFADGLLIRATILRRLGRVKEACQAYRAALAAAPRRADAYEQAALDMMLAGACDRAHEFAQQAATNGVLSKRLELLNGALIKAQKGPNWARTYDHESTNYHVFSDIDKRTCIEASKLLEEAFTAYRVHFGWVSRDRTRKFKVYLFSGRAGFIQYQEDVEALMGSPAIGAAGLYSPLLKQLLIWNLPNRDEMFATIRHEGFHQYLDRFMTDPPIWFNEGLAVYHEDAERKAGRLVLGQIQHEYLDTLKKGLAPLKEFVVQSERKFYEGGSRSYAQAWAFVHMLQHGTAEQKALFERLVEELSSGDAAADVVQRVFTEDLCDDLDIALAAYVTEMGE